MRIAHVIHRLDMGGMETGLINLINSLPREDFSHTVVCLTYSTDWCRRIEREDVDIIELKNPAGNHPSAYLKAYRQLRKIRPHILHTRNFGTIDIAWLGKVAGCPVRIHGEHGWHSEDLGGLSRKHRCIRRVCDSAIHGYIAVSKDIASWLESEVGIAKNKIHQIYNGIDSTRFAQLRYVDGTQECSEKVVFGTVGRQDKIKGLDVLLEALHQLSDRRPDLCESLEVVLAGDGPEHDACAKKVVALGLGDVVNMPGRVNDIVSLMGRYEFFVQPSLNEGISNTVLEAMSAGLPVVATNVGGNPELIRHGQEGQLVPAGHVESLSAAIEVYLDNPRLRTEHGAAARNRVQSKFALDSMVQSYSDFYRELALKHGVVAA